MKSITIKTICDTAGALKLTQYGNKEAMKFAKNKEEDSLLVVNELKAIEFCTRKAIFVYPKGFVSYVEEVN